LREITASHIVKAFTRMDNFNAVQGQARIVEALEDAGYSPDDYVPPEDYAEALSRAVNNAVDPGADLRSTRPTDSRMAPTTSSPVD
jgi:hypothetical protein